MDSRSIERVDRDLDTPAHLLICQSLRQLVHHLHRLFRALGSGSIDGEMNMLNLMARTDRVKVFQAGIARSFRERMMISLGISYAKTAHVEHVASRLTEPLVFYPTSPRTRSTRTKSAQTWVSGWIGTANA